MICPARRMIDHITTANVQRDRHLGKYINTGEICYRHTGNQSDKDRENNLGLLGLEKSLSKHFNYYNRLILYGFNTFKDIINIFVWITLIFFYLMRKEK